MKAPLRRRQESILLWSAAGALAVVALAPLGWLLGELVAPGSGAAAERLAPFGAGRTWALLFRSLGLAAAVTTGALALGCPLGSRSEYARTTRPTFAAARAQRSATSS